MKVSFSPPDIGEEEIKEVISSLSSGWITTGPKTKEFERKIAKYCHTPKAVCLNSATAAMEMTLRLLGVEKEDEVIVPSYTYTATCSVICHVGATPVMVDIGSDSLEMDYTQLEKAITKKTKVIIPVDIGGILCDYEKIFEIVKNKKDLFQAKNEIQKKFNRIIVMADSAHGFGATRNEKKSGEFADFTCFSFHAVKNLTTAEGGAVTWKSNPVLENEELYQKYQILSLHGQTKDAFSKNKLGAWEYDILQPAYKCNMTDIQAGIGLAQLSRYKNFVKRRHELIAKYNQAFQGQKISTLKHKTENTMSSGHLYIVRLIDKTMEQRNEIIIKMAERGIVTNVHYKPLPMLTAYRNLGYDIKDYSNSYEFFKQEITLPLYSKMTEEEVEYVIKNFLEILREYDIKKI